jgi:hypothetical protein
VGAILELIFLPFHLLSGNLVFYSLPCAFYVSFVFLMRGAILHARVNRNVIRKMIIPAVQSPIIFKVSNQENMDPIVLSCSAVTTISDRAFDSVSWSRPTKSFKIFNCSISITLWVGWAFNAKSKSLSLCSSNSAIKSRWVV